jgi:hypothetical protein
MKNQILETMIDYIRHNEHDSFEEFCDVGSDTEESYEDHIYYKVLTYEILEHGKVIFNNNTYKSVEELNAGIEDFIKNYSYALSSERLERTGGIYLNR